MERGARVLMCQVVILLVLCWIYAVQGSSINVSCTDDNCTSTRIGDPCSSQADCRAITSSQCQNDTCQCNYGYVPTNESTECVLHTTSDQCTNHSNCSDVTANSYCHTNGTCLCFDGYLFDGSNCVARKLDDFCTKDSDCTKVLNNTQCLKRQCKCLNLYLREDNSTCRLRRLQDSCTKAKECNHGEGKSMVCLRGLCKCAKGYREALDDTLGHSICVRVTLGGSCTKRSDCSHIAFSECGSGRTCQCRRELGRRASANNETCEVIQLNEDCSDNLDCQNINHSLCLLGNCSCEPGYTQDITGRFCKPVLLGDPCRGNSDCSVVNSYCNNSNMCSCVKGFESLNGSSHCTEMIIEETKCNTPEDCFNHFPNAVCTSTGFCRCEPQYHLSPNGTQCLLRHIGDSCNSDAECLYSVPSTLCVFETCQCMHTHLPSSDKTNCAPKKIGGMACATHADCYDRVPHSSCDVDNSSTCRCDTGYSMNETFDGCLEKRLFEPCSTNAECDTTNPHSFCSNMSQSCQCFPEFVPTFPDGIDSPFAPIFSKPFCSRRTIGDQSCETKEHCSSAIANSTCGLCQGGPKDVPCLKRCLALSMSDTAISPDLLNSSSTCLLKTCVCDKGFLASTDRRQCERIKLREPCRTDEDCSINTPNSVCLPTGICFCAPGFREGGSYECTQYQLGDQCRKGPDCEKAVPSSHCDIPSDDTRGYGVCKCNSGYHGNDEGNECRKRHIGDGTCQVDTDCSDAVNNSRCHIGMCVCDQGFFRSHDYTQCNKRRLYLDYCENIPDCNTTISNAVCESYRCKCPSGYSDNGDECRKKQINDKCNPKAEDCSDAVGNSTCVGVVNGVCRCVSGFVAVDNDTCVRRRILDSTCQIHQDCTDAVGNSSCRNGTCLCDTGYYHSIDRTVCLSRKLGDTCNKTSDCLSVIDNSNCVTNVCDCLVGYDPHGDNSSCVSRPTKIEKDPCYFTEQCRRVDPASTCNLTREQTWRCVCPPGTLTAANWTACVKLPTRVGDHCNTSEHCQSISVNSSCANNTCTCSGGYFADSNKTTCHPDPEKFGDFCQEDQHCNKTLVRSKCELENNTCVCEYGYTQKTTKMCVERDILPQYTPIDVPTPPTCASSTCHWTNSRCVKVAMEICRCQYRHALLFNSSRCVPVQTYQLNLSLIAEAGRYDYQPLVFQKEYLSPKLPIFEEFANRITVNGLMIMFNETWSLSHLKDRYVASEVLRFQNLDMAGRATSKGVKATVLLHLTAHYMNATPVEDIYDFFEENLHSSDGLLGRSALKVATPYSQAVVFTDFDECQDTDRNDCHRHAICINTLGSYMCVCRYGYLDKSKDKRNLPGRLCEVPANVTNNKCDNGDDNCKTSWEFVGLTLALFLLIVMAFITYEIIQRKKSFTARKLYEKFGTTKIRKLRQASMHRLQERKKRMKEESQTKKEEQRQKKEDLKREKSEKNRLKDEERKVKQEEKKRKDLEKKEAKKSATGRSSNDVEWFGAEEARGSSSEPEEVSHPTSSPCPATADDDDDDIGSLPGSVNSPDTEMTFPRMTSSCVEESNV